jgi:hypothetical protein
MPGAMSFHAPGAVRLGAFYIAARITRPSSPRGSACTRFNPYIKTFEYSNTAFYRLLASANDSITVVN